MSTYEVISTPKYRLKTIDEVRAGLSMQNSDRPVVHFTKEERENRFLNSINLFIKDFKKNSKALSNLKLDTIDTLSRLHGLTEAIKANRNDTLSGYLIENHSEILKKNELLLESIKDTGFSENRNSVDLVSINNNLNELKNLYSEVNNKIARVEKDILKNKVLESLEELGYSTRKKVSTGNVLIKGENGDRFVAATINKNNELHIDIAGFEGNSCSNDINLIHSKLNEKGIEIDIKKQIFHGKKEGGVLAQSIKKEFAHTINIIDTITKTGSKLKKKLKINSMKTKIKKR